MTLDARAAEKYIILNDYEDGNNLDKVKDLGIITVHTDVSVAVRATTGQSYTAKVWLMNEKMDDYSTATDYAGIASFESQEGKSGSFYLIDKLQEYTNYYLQVMVSKSGSQYNVYFYLTEITETIVKGINITISEPVGGQKLQDQAPNLVLTPTGPIRWKANGEVVDDSVAKYDTVYTMEVQYKAGDGQVFDDNEPVTVNGKQASWEMVAGTDNKLCLITYTFPKTDSAPVQEIVDSVAITIDKPEAGKALPTVENGVSVSTPGVKVDDIIWYEGKGGNSVTGTAGYNTTYTATVILMLEENSNYQFAPPVQVSINDKERGSFELSNGKLLITNVDFPATDPDPEKTINSIDITIESPVGGKPFPSEVPSLSNATGMIEWMKLGGVSVSGLAEYDTKYIAQIEYEAMNGYVFADNVTASVNGESASFKIIEGTNNKHCLITRTFQTAKEGQAQTVSNIEITVPQPVGGQALPTISDVKQTVTGAKATKILWCEGDNTESKPYVTGNAKYNTVYTMRILYEAEDGYIFDNNTTATVNGNKIKFWITAYSKDKKGEVTYTFPATGAEQTQTISNIAITAPEPVGGQKLPYFPDVTYETTEVRGTGINWYKGTGVSDANAASGTAEYNTVYTMRIRYDAKDGYIFGSDTTASVNGKPEKCELGTDKKVCYVTYTFPVTGPEPSGGDYKIIEGNNSNYVPGSDKPLSFRGDGEFNEFLRVEVDGKIVEEKYYTKEAGSTIITFTPEYLATLSEGSHTVKMVWGVNGEEKPAECSFYIGENGGEAVPGNTGTTQPANGSESKPRHTCNFEWVITVDPTTGADGLEEYKCTGCGAVSESHPIPASVALIKDFYGKVKEAPEKGSITYDSGKLYTISDYVLKKMAERNDVSVTVKFEYKNKKFQLTFPAGLDYSAVLTDKENMYGYFGVAAKLGLKVTEQ